MAELATIARPYAEALFRSVSSKGIDLVSTAAWVDELAVIAADSQLLQLADNPGVNAQQVLDVITGVVRQPLPEVAKNLLRVIIENGRLPVLPEVASQFRALVNRSNGSAQAVVYSAFPMTDAALVDIRQTLEKRFNRKLNFSVKLDESLIGGIRIEVGDEVLDTSVKARLEQMKAALTA